MILNDQVYEDQAPTEMAGAFFVDVGVIRERTLLCDQYFDYFQISFSIVPTEELHHHHERTDQAS